MVIAQTQLTPQQTAGNTTTQTPIVQQNPLTTFNSSGSIGNLIPPSQTGSQLAAGTTQSPILNPVPQQGITIPRPILNPVPQQGITIPQTTSSPFQYAGINNPSLLNQNNPIFQQQAQNAPGFTAQTPQGPPQQQPMQFNYLQQVPSQQSAPQQQPQQAQQQQSLENQALNGGGASNKQQISNFMTALQNSGSSGGNSFQNYQNPSAAPVSNIVNPAVANQNNGSTAGINPGGAVSTQAGSNVANSANTTANTAQNSSANNYGVSESPGSTPFNPFQNGNNSAPSSVNWTPAVPVTPAAQLASNPAVSTSLYNQAQNNQNIAAQPAAQLASNPAVSTSLYNQAQNNQNISAPVVSDENLKTNISQGRRQLNDFLSKIGAHSYEYKNPNIDGQGRFVSPMAQELEKTELGKSAVINTARGKMVDYGRLGGVNLAAASVLYREQQRIDAALNNLTKQFRDSLKTKKK